jgi:hypothetical protein
MELFPGTPAPEYSNVVAIHYTTADGKDHICTGTLVSRRLVLTAGHCGCGIPGSYTVDFRQDARVRINPRRSNVEGNPILYDQRVCVDGDLRGGRDLALLRLYQDVQNLVDREFPLINLADESDLLWHLLAKLAAARSLIAVGYGYTESGLLGLRMRASIPIASIDCSSRFAAICAPFTEMVLAQAPGPSIRADTCGGDSGGPIFLVDGKRHILVAVTSRAVAGARHDVLGHCGGGGIYTLIGRKSVHAWLRGNGVPVGPEPTPPSERR